MKASEIKCTHCGDDLWEASQRGAYLKRANPKGELPMIVECAPSCDKKTGNQEDALMGAILDK